MSEAGDVESRLGLARVAHPVRVGGLRRHAIRHGPGRAKASPIAFGRRRRRLDQRPAVVKLKARVLQQTALLQSRSGNPKEAIVNLKSAISAARAARRGAHAGLGVARAPQRALDVGQYLQPLGQAAEALEEVKRAVEIRRAMLKERPANLANRLRAARVSLRSPKSRATWDRARRHSKTSRGSCSPGIGTSREPAQRSLAQSAGRACSAERNLAVQAGTSRGNSGQFEQTVPILEELVQIEPQVPCKSRRPGRQPLQHRRPSKVSGQVRGLAQGRFRRPGDPPPDGCGIPSQPKYRFQVAASLGNIGGTFVVVGNRTSTALVYFREAIAVLAELASRTRTWRSIPSICRATARISAAFSVRLGRFEAALAVFQADESFLESRVLAQPKLVQARLDLAFNLGQQAESCVWLRRYEEADRFNRRALEVLLAVPEAGRLTPDVLQMLVITFERLGNTAAQSRELRRGCLRNTAGRSPLLNPIRRYCRPRASVRGTLRSVLEGRAEANARLGRLDAARADWFRLASMPGPGEPDPFPLGPILIRAWSGDAAGFVVDAEAAVAAGAVKNNQFVTLARAACVAIPNRELGCRPERSTRRRRRRLAPCRPRRRRLREERESGKSLSIPASTPSRNALTFRDLKDDLTFPIQPFASETTTP